MALAIDASTPAIAVQSNGDTTTVTTASFTPPVGALLLIRWTGNTVSSELPSVPTITDNLSPDLTYTLLDWHSRADSPGVNCQSAQWWAIATDGAAMTITVTSGAGPSQHHAALHVTVLTGQDPVTPIGAHGKSGDDSGASIAQSYTAESTGGWGFIAAADWDDKGAMTAGSGCTTTDGGGGSVPGQFSYGFVRRTTADDSVGATNTLNVTLPGTSTNISWVWAEVNPYIPGDDPLPRWANQPPPWLLYSITSQNQRMQRSYGEVPYPPAAGPFLDAVSVIPFHTGGSSKSVRVMTMPGDVLVIVAGSENSTIALSSPTGGGLSYSSVQSIVVLNFATAYVWTATESGAGSTFNFSLTSAGTTEHWGAVVYRFSSSTGVGASNKTNVSTGAPSLSLTTTQDNSAIVTVNTDWSAINGASRVWRTINGITPTGDNTLEKAYVSDGAQYTAYTAYYPDAGAAGAQTTGLSAPGGQTYSIISVEVKGPAAGTNAPAEATAATGLASDATIDITVPAEATAATGSAPDAVASIGVSAEATAATGAAADATIDLAPTSQATAATGSAPDPSIAIAVSAEATAATGVASDATVQTSSDTNAPAEATAATGTAPDATIDLASSAQATAATGSASDATVTLTISAEATAATGTASDASVSVTATAEATAATGTATSATIGAGAGAEATAGTGAAADAGPAISVTAEAAVATGAASDATVEFLAAVGSGPPTTSGAAMAQDIAGAATGQSTSSAAAAPYGSGGALGPITSVSGKGYL